MTAARSGRVALGVRTAMHACLHACLNDLRGLFSQTQAWVMLHSVSLNPLQEVRARLFQPVGIMWLSSHQLSPLCTRVSDGASRVCALARHEHAWMHAHEETFDPSPQARNFSAARCRDRLLESHNLLPACTVFCEISAVLSHHACSCARSCMDAL